MKKIFFAIMAAVAVLAGCSKEIVTGGGTGKLEFSVASVDDTWNDRQEGMTDGAKAATKAYDKEEVLSSLIVTISNHDGVGEPRQWVYSEMPAVLELTEGRYSITASSPESRIAAWDLPVFGGSEEFSITAGRTSTVELVCSLTNVKVTVNCSDAFKSEFSSYSITVTSAAATAEEGFLIWGADEVEAGKEGYFAAADLTVTVQAYRWSDATGQKDPVSAALPVTGVEAKDHIILNIDAQATGAVSTDGAQGEDTPFIVIDDGTNNRTEDIFIGGLEEIPVPGDGNEPVEKPDAPTLEWAANPEFAPTVIEEDMDVNLVVKAPGRIKDFVVSVESDFLAQMLPSMTSDQSMNMDLINDQKLISTLGTLAPGLPTGDALDGKDNVNFSLSSLVPLIQLGGTPGSEHVFTLNVTDEYGQELSQSLVFVMPGSAE